MFELVSAGGWLMAPIIICSIIALAIIAERLWSLRTLTVIPHMLVSQVWDWANHKTSRCYEITGIAIRFSLRANSRRCTR